MKRKFSYYDLPIELEEQILSKLPLKSIIRLRSVCKTWNSIITGKKFVNDHLQANIHKTNSAFYDNDAPSSVIVFNDDYDTELVYLLTISDYATFDEEIYEPKIPKNEVHWHVFSYHCNGIVCRVDNMLKRQRIVFYNPTLRQHRTLIIPLEREANYVFGHDPKTDDYKLIRTALEDHGAVKAEAYSLRTKRWREFETQNLLPEDHGRAYLKGCCYWVDCAAENLMSFDISSESFSSFDLPPGIEWEESDGPSVMPRGDSLVCMVPNYATPRISFEGWVMDINGGWAKQFKIDPSVVNLGVGPVAFWKEDELLMESGEWVDKKRGGLTTVWLTYNLHSKQFRKLYFPAIGIECLSLISLYVESLVSVKASKNKIVGE